MPSNDPAATSPDARLAATLSGLAARMLPGSSHSVVTAGQLASIDGVGCLLVLRIPEKVNAPVEATFHSGRAKLRFDVE